MHIPRFLPARHQALLGALEELFPLNPAPTTAPSVGPRYARGRHVLIEYILLAGVNDNDEDARRLLQLMRNIRCKVNLIVFNPHEGTRFDPSSPERVLAFRSVLIQGGLVATVRDSRGDDQMAACGQLGGVGDAPGTRSPPPVLQPPERMLGALRPGLATAS